MSDFFDSLEEESEDEKFSLESLNEWRAKSSSPVGKLCNGGTTKKYSFFLNENAPEESINLLPIFQSSQAITEGKNFLPKIDIRSKEKSPPSTFFVDPHILKEQGLQLNEDGSFTKSPAPPEEKLPFITREYRNLQFQKKKTWAIKNSPPLKAQKKNIFSFTKNTIDGIRINEFVNAKKKKNSSEDVLTSEGSLHSKSPEKLKMFVGNHNMTDSIKEKLLEILGENQTTETPNEPKGKNLGKTCDPSKEKRISLLKKIEAPKKDNSFRVLPENSPKGSVAQTRNPKKVGMKIPKFRSDILIKIPKPKLSYSEQHQLKKGYNPFSLRHDSKKVPTDTNRSTFGDSMVEELPEISSRYVSCNNLDDEGEEKFYLKLMELEKRRTEIQCSARSDGPYQLVPFKNLLESTKGQKEVLSGKIYPRYKPASKSLSIDMPCDADNSTKMLKKFSHYCSADSSRTSSKVELALKARTYGYLVNARNIFKFKAQSEAKLNDSETEKNLKNKERVFPPPKKALGFPLTTSKLLKQNSLPVNGFLIVKGESLRNCQNLPRVSASCCKTKQSEKFQNASCREDSSVLYQSKT